jgi:glutamyl-tRNA reductase
MTKSENLLKDFSCIGVNHWSAPVIIRERFSLSESRKKELFEEAKRRKINQLIIVSTCNRTELFAKDCETSDLIELYVAFSNGTLAEFDEYGFETFGEDAVRHLFEVAVGLDAQILGDLQIIKQVKESYEASKLAGLCSSDLHRLMQIVFKTHKRIRKETDLGVGAASVASAAVQFAQHHFRNFSEKHVVLVGTGKMGKITCKNLLNLGVKKITLVNRSEEKAEALAEKFNVAAASFNQMEEVFETADLVIVATGSQNPVVSKKHLSQVPQNGSKRFYIDLSVPRNIDEDVREHSGVVLINMDDLQSSMDQAFMRRKAAVPMANQIIRNELHSYRKWLAEQQLAPAITAVNERLETIRKSELEKIQHLFSESDWEKIELLTHRIIRKIANDKLEELREYNLISN